MSEGLETYQDCHTNDHPSSCGQEVGEGGFAATKVFSYISLNLSIYIRLGIISLVLHMKKGKPIDTK